MKPRNLIKWDYNNGLENLLFFAQTLDVLLFHHSLDSFKANALNTHTRTFELFVMAKEVKNGTVKGGALKPIIAELSWSIKNDPVIKVDKTGIYDTFVERIESIVNNKEHSNEKNSDNENKKKPIEKNIEEIITITHSMLNDLERNYWIWLKNKLIQAIQNTDNNENKKEISQLTMSLTAEIELRGFSRSYLYATTKGFFFENGSEPYKITSLSQINEFFNLFEVKEKKWKIILRGSKTITSYSAYAPNFSIKIDESIERDFKFDANVESFLNKKSEYPMYITFDNLSFKDGQRAKSNALYKLETFLDICNFFDHKTEVLIDLEGIAIDIDKNSATLLKPTPHPMLFASMRGGKEAEEGVSQIIEIFKNHPNLKDGRALLRALEYHKAALKTITPENQLLDLWAALEGFLPSPDENGDRISHYVDKLLPCIVLTYTQRIFKYISDSIFNYKEDIKTMIEKIPIHGTFQEKVIGLLVCSEFENERTELYSKLDQNPLLRNKCFCCNEDFKSPKHIKKTLERHKDKVKWQIQRIYSTRNMIIHSAKSEPYLETLVENLHSYIDRLITSIAELMIRYPDISISSGLGLLSLYEKSYLKNLDKKKDEECTLINFRDYVFGNNNPIL